MAAFMTSWRFSSSFLEIFSASSRQFCAAKAFFPTLSHASTEHRAMRSHREGHGDQFEKLLWSRFLGGVAEHAAALLEGVARLLRRPFRCERCPAIAHLELRRH
eukprot:6200471-Pyramimonas_sp.AAC.1